MSSFIHIEEYDLLEVIGGGNRRHKRRKNRRKNKCCPRVKDDDRMKVKIIGGTFYGSVLFIANDDDGRGQGNIRMRP